MTEIDPNPGAPSLEPPPSKEKSWLRWSVLILVINVLGMAWLGMRQDSSESVQLVLDSGIQIACGGLLAFFAYRMLTRFPFRTTELMTMVIVLSLGELLTLEMLGAFKQASLVFEGREREAQLGPTVQACLLTATVLLLGGALGLRYCFKLSLEGTFTRMWAVASGMLSMPAATGFLGFPALAASELLSEDGPTDLLGIYLLSWFASCIFFLSNVVYLVKSSAVEAEVTWRKPVKK